MYGCLEHSSQRSSLIFMQNMEFWGPSFEQAKVSLVLDRWKDVWWTAKLLPPTILYTMLLASTDSNQVQSTYSYDKLLQTSLTQQTNFAFKASKKVFPSVYSWCQHNTSHSLFKSNSLILNLLATWSSSLSQYALHLYIIIVSVFYNCLIPCKA